MDDERFQNCISYIIYDIEQYPSNKKRKFVSDLRNQFSNDSSDYILQVTKAIEDALIV
jgi:hypothetical protein